MSIFAISDLHMSLGCDKPMDIFGSKWTDYTERMCRNWNSVVTDEDLVIIPGDISWATYIEDAEKDFDYINRLKGKKVILKGNHDYWWTTSSKMNAFLEEKAFDSIKILNNTAYLFGDTAVCGTRGWIFPPIGSEGDNQKIFEREKQRLVLALEDAKSTGAKDIIVAIHYPPVDSAERREDFLDIMRAYGVKTCIYGHLHGTSHHTAPTGEFSGIKLILVSCDYLNFLPKLIKK